MNHNVFFITTIDVADKENKTFTWRTPGFRYSLKEAKEHHFAREASVASNHDFI